MGEELTVDKGNIDDIVKEKKSKKKRSKSKKKDEKSKVQCDNDGDSKKKREKKQKKEKKQKETKGLKVIDEESYLKIEEDNEDKDAHESTNSANENSENDDDENAATEEKNDEEQDNFNHDDSNNNADEEDETLPKKKIIHDDDNENGDDRKIFLSRIHDTFNKDSITRIFEKVFGEGCIDEIALCVKREDDNIDESDERGDMKKKKEKEETSPHRGFAFVTMSSVELRSEAIARETVRGSAKEQSKRKHTMYIRPIVREEEGGSHGDDADDNKAELNICFLWSKHRCPYGDECKFKHIGEGGCIEKNEAKDAASRMKKQKCFSFRTKGKCKLGDKCPYSHDIKVKCTVISNGKEYVKKDPKDKDCISWKTKGKCRRRDKCPYKHDESVREAFLAKKEKKNNAKKRGRSDNPQPLSIRVFGLNYDTKEEDIRAFFEHCGPIREITFPTYEDSGRSKGYCGVLFTSPKATEKATEMDGSSLHGRWLSIQAGKMYLKQWEEREHERTMEMKEEEVKFGEFGQKVKKRKKHGFNDN